MTPKKAKIINVFLSPFIIVPLMIIIFSVALLIKIAPVQVFASSAYDTWIAPPSTLSVDVGACNEVDITADIDTIISSAPTTLTTQQIADLRQAKDTGVLTLAQHFESGFKIVTITFNLNPDTTLNWNTNGVYIGGTVSRAYISQQTSPGCAIQITGYQSPASSGYQYLDSPEGVQYNEFYRIYVEGVFTANYPTGYAGATIIPFYVPPPNYDTNYQLTNQIRLTDDTLTCGDQSMNSTWYNFLQDATTSQTHYISQLNLDNAKNGLNNAINNGGSWGVLSNRNTLTSDQTITVYWTETGTSNITFGTDYVTLTKQTGQDNISYIQYMIKFAHDGSGGCSPEIINYYHKTATSIIISSKTSIYPNIKSIFNAGSTVTYPDGYAGTLIKTSYSPPITVYPQVQYQVESYTIKALYKNNIITSNSQNIILTWLLRNKDQYGNWQDYNTQDLNYLQQYIVDVPDLGEYKLYLSIALNGETLADGLSIGTTEVNIEVTGYDYGQDCLESVCAFVSPYEDCSIYSYTQLTQNLGCHLTNNLTRLKLFFTNLIVPNPLRIQRMVTDQQGRIEEELGGIGYPVTFFIDLGQQINDQADTATCGVTQTLPMFGTIEFGLCNTAFGTAETFVYAVIRGTFALSLILLLYRIYNNIIEERTS